MARELVGTEIGSYATLVAMISFMLTGHRSVYPSPILKLRKSDSLEINVGETIRDLKTEEYLKHRK